MLCFCSRRPCPPDPPPPHLWRLCPGMLFAAPLISHVIPLCLIQTLNLHRWNCNVFGTSRKMTTINYVRNVGAVVSSQPTGAASGPRRPRAPQLGPPAPPGPSISVTVGVCSTRRWLAACRRRVTPLMTPFSPFGGGQAPTGGGVAAKLQTTSEKNGDNGVLWLRWSAFWAQRCLSWSVVRTSAPEHAHEPFDAHVSPSTCTWAAVPTRISSGPRADKRARSPPVGLTCGTSPMRSEAVR